MAITLNGSTGITAPAVDAALDASDITGSLPSVDGSALTNLNASALTGSLPAINGSALTGVGPSTSYGDVGTYAFMYYSPQGYPTAGFTASGSSLYPANGYSYGGWSGYNTASGSATGTWRLMGLLGYYSNTARGQADTSNSVWVRIA